MRAALTACTPAENGLPCKVYFGCLIRPCCGHMFYMHPQYYWPVPVLQGIQHLGSAMGCFMRMKGINFHDIHTAPATQAPSTVTGSQDGHNASVLPAIIQSGAVSISPVVLCPATAPVSTDTANPNKRQKTKDATAKAVSHIRQSTSGVKVMFLCLYPCSLRPKQSNA